MKIELVDLKRQLNTKHPGSNETLLEEITSAINECVENTSFIMGPYLEKFERNFADYCGAKYCVGLNSGTDAVEFALRCNGISSGEVITTPATYFTSVSPISAVGATPIFGDINPATFNIDEAGIEKLIGPNTKAIALTHFYGRPVNMDFFADLARKYDLKIIEDCAHSPGSEYDGKKAPFFGTGAFSFFPGKNLGAWGDAGALVTNDSEIATRARLLRNDGSEKKYVHEILGRKARMDGIQATILNTKLKYLDNWNEQRRELANQYNRLLSGVEEIQLPLLEDRKTNPVFHIYNILSDDRDDLLSFLHRSGISAGIHYPVPVHLQPAYSFLGLNEGSFPVAEEFSRKTLSLPLFPEMRPDEIRYVSDKVKEYYRFNKSD